jgi:DNA (cytosine-5)-methyltransferase 1
VLLRDIVKAKMRRKVIEMKKRKSSARLLEFETGRVPIQVGHNHSDESPIRFIDLFCGIGGFHEAARSLGLTGVFACDIDEECRKAYHHNYGLMPYGDIREIEVDDIPDHDLLCAGFPCQPFSIIGDMAGFADSRGTLFFELERIIMAKKPRMIVLENVRQLVSHNGGKSLAKIMLSLRRMGYWADYRVLNALNFGLPHKRERVIIVAFRDNIDSFPWPIRSMPMKPLSALLEKSPGVKHFVSERIRLSRFARHTPKMTPSIWHENKAGNVSSHPFSCALRAGASYNYLLVNGERRLTPREMLRLQGFPDDFEIICNDSQTRKQAGNSVPVPMIRAILERVINAANCQIERKRA